MRSFAIAVAALLLGACQPAPPAPSDAAQHQAPARAADIEVSSPQPGAALASPLRVFGVAPNTWYFEGVFDARLIGADGRLIAQVPAQGQTDWTVEGPVPFVAEFQFEVSAQESATIVLTEDQSGEKPTVREIRIPVVLMPPG